MCINAITHDSQFRIIFSALIQPTSQGINRISSSILFLNCVKGQQVMKHMSPRTVSFSTKKICEVSTSSQDCATAWPMKDHERSQSIRKKIAWRQGVSLYALGRNLIQCLDSVVSGTYSFNEKIMYFFLWFHFLKDTLSIYNQILITDTEAMYQNK